MHQLIESFNNAIEGFLYVLRSQRNMRLHFLLGVLVFISGIVLDFSRTELVCLGLIVTSVLFAEMLNTTIEHLVDLISDTYHPLARIIKDISAGAVLLAAISAAIFGYILFAKHIVSPFILGIDRIKNSPVHVTVISLIVVMALVIFGKVVFRRGTPMRGGMPSGHSAVVFCLWAIVVFSTSNPLIIALTFLMAAALARTRMSEGVHTLWEVAAGSLLGFLTTLLIVQILR